jgi:tetratricopeptide (TPR) repeat protein
MNEIVVCCAECGSEAGGGVSLKTCMSCMHVKYCNVECQKKHWPKHKQDCKIRAAELRDEALFSDPPPKEDCPLCFLPMPSKIIYCTSLPPATTSSIPIYDYMKENVELVDVDTDEYFPCCGKSICGGCVYSFRVSGNMKCPFCNSDRNGKTDVEMVEEMTKRVEANDPVSICMLGNYYYNGRGGLQQDHSKGMELYARAADLGYSQAHCNLGICYGERGDLKKAKFHYEAAAMLGDEIGRYSLGCIEFESGNMDRALKHWTIAASAGGYIAMYNLKNAFEQGALSRESIDSALAAYNSSCAEIRSEARDAYIRAIITDTV